MGAVLEFFYVILGSIGLCTGIGLIGYFATTRARNDHTEKMVELSDKSKLTAITIKEKDHNLSMRQMGELGVGSLVGNGMNRETFDTYMKEFMKERGIE